MLKVGDRIRLSSGKGSDREGAVTAVMGSMVRVRWSSASETTVIPAPGTLTVLAASRARAPQKPVPKKAPSNTGAKKATSKKAASKTGAKTATSKKAATKAGAKTATSKKAATKKSSGAKRSSR
jgi:hypothetical protein